MAYQRKIFHRDEKCLNCDTPIIGNFCGNCGQKAHLHKDSFLHMAGHFVGDYFHYDGKFWITVKTLLTKPGLITLEYIQGKRVKYLNPIQLYIFVTTLFFLVSHFINIEREEKKSTNHKQKDEILSNVRDSLNKDTQIDVDLAIRNTENGTQIGIGNWTPKEKTLFAYDSVQNIMPEESKDGFIKRFVRRKVLRVSEDEEFSEKFMHSLKSNIPKIFFLLLPFFALLLKLIYYKKKHFYVDHLIFSIHFHSVGFILLLVYLLLAAVNNSLNFTDDIIAFLTAIAIGVYLFLSFKRVYPSPAWKIIFKQLILFFLYFIGFVFSILLIVLITFIFY